MKIKQKVLMERLVQETDQVFIHRVATEFCLVRITCSTMYFVLYFTVTPYLTLSDKFLAVCWLFF